MTLSRSSNPILKPLNPKPTRQKSHTRMEPNQQTMRLTPRTLLVTPHTRKSPKRRYQLSQYQLSLPQLRMKKVSLRLR